MEFDFSFLLLAAKGVLPAVAALIAMGALMIVPLVARWAVRKLIAMFGDGPDDWGLAHIDKDYSYAFTYDDDGFTYDDYDPDDDLDYPAIREALRY